jgi:hypothetical protein
VKLQPTSRRFWRRVRPEPGNRSPQSSLPIQMMDMKTTAFHEIIAPIRSGTGVERRSRSRRA